VDSSLLSGDETSKDESHRNLLRGLMQTDPTEAGVPSTHDSGFTQAWDTVGAGALKTRVRESSAERSVRLQL